ncbi:hypothetical protein [Chloroflexus sp.]|uniref:hypothetical protein n=1 Tax=Chloroflexus sp. TaxID=1904827 RepID=UPI00404A27B6
MECGSHAAAPAVLRPTSRGVALAYNLLMFSICEYAWSSHQIWIDTVHYRRGHYLVIRSMSYPLPSGLPLRHAPDRERARCGSHAAAL